MKDSERAAELALTGHLDVGLHLNFTERYNGSVSARVTERQERINGFLLKNRYAQVLYNPLLRRDFQYLCDVQYAEFMRLYSRQPTHIDGHHHMHLCTNILVDRLLPLGARVRKNFSFTSDEKGSINRSYRLLVDAILRRRYVCTDYFFDIAPIECLDRLRMVVKYARSFTVEMMVHPQRTEEFDYLMSDEYWGIISTARMGRYEEIESTIATS